MIAVISSGTRVSGSVVAGFGQTGGRRHGNRHTDYRHGYQDVHGKAIGTYVGGAYSTTPSMQTVFAGGRASGTNVDYYGDQTVSSGGVAVNTDLFSGGGQGRIRRRRQRDDRRAKRLPGDQIGRRGQRYPYRIWRTAVGRRHGRQHRDRGGGTQYLNSTGVASDTTIENGGTQQIEQGGAASGTRRPRRRCQYVDYGTAANTTSSSGGIEVVGSGGTASGITVLSGERAGDGRRKHKRAGRPGWRPRCPGDPVLGHDREWRGHFKWTVPGGFVGAQAPLAPPSRPG